MSYTITHFYRFGDFALDADQRVLLRGEKPVALTPKVFETLLVLVEQHGRIVGKDELMGRLWPNSFVEESNLTFNVQRLRKALGDNARQPRYVETVSRRGYRFIADVAEVLAETGVVQDQVNLQPYHEPSRDLLERDEQRQPLMDASRPDSDIARARQEPLVASESILAIPASATRRPVFVAAAAVALLLLGAVSVWHFVTGLNRKQNGNRLATSLKVQRLTETGKNRSAAISPDGNYLAYTLDAKGRQGIWLRQLSTGTGSEIVSPSERVAGLTFAHSGQHLYFVKGLPPSWAMYRVTLPLGGLPEKVIEKPEGSFSLSPDDRQVAFVRYSSDDRECALMVADDDGSNERALAVHQQPDRFNTPAWSPDGRTIAVAVGPSDSGREQVRIVVFNVADGSEKEVPTGKWFNISRIVWSPAGSGMFIVGNTNVGQRKQIWRVQYPGGEVKQLTDGATSYSNVSITADADKAVATQVSFISDMWVGPADEPQKLKRITHAAEDFCWTPDGRIIYSSHAGINLDLWVMQPDGTGLKQLTDVGERNATPTITPDGRYIIFTSTRSGGLQIWRMELDGSNPIQLTSGKGANFPSISPDGHWIFYNNVDDWSVWKTSIEGAESVRITDRDTIYPSVSPDGKLIACVGKDDNKNRKLLIISSAGGKPLQEISIAPLKLSSYRLQWLPHANALRFAASTDGIVRIYKQPLEGSALEKMIELKEDNIFDFGYAPDNRQLAVTRGDWQFDIVLLSGLNQ